MIGAYEADTQLRFEELKLSLIEQARVFHFGTLSLTDELCEEELREITEFACKAAGLSTTRPGGICAVPSPEELCCPPEKIFRF